MVDTGSTDRTKEVAAQMGAKVKLYDFPWVDSFAAARNESLRHATGEWVMWLDADDSLDELNRQKLRILLHSLTDENAAYVMQVVCLPDQTAAVTAVDHVKLFRNRSEHRFTYRVHEQVLPALRRTAAEVRTTDIQIHHSGYVDPQFRRSKLERDRRLVELDLREHPDDPFDLFNLGQIHFDLGEHEACIRCMEGSIRGSDPRDSQVRKCHAVIVHAYRNLNRLDDALRACRQGRTLYPEDPELLFHEGLIHYQQRNYAAAEACFLRILEDRDEAHFSSLDVGIKGYKTRHNLATVYWESGQPEKAEIQWRRAMSKSPEFFPAWAGLGELLLGQGRWREAEGIVSSLLTEDGDHQKAGGQGRRGAEGSRTAWQREKRLNGFVLQGRLQMQRQQWTAARQSLEAARDLDPHALAPQVFLSHLLLQTHDLSAAENALRALLRLHPQNAEAHHNLGGVCLETGRPQEAIEHYQSALALGYAPSQRMLTEAQRAVSTSAHPASTPASVPPPPAVIRGRRTVAYGTRVLFVNHHHFGDGLLQLGGIKTLRERHPQRRYFYCAIGVPTVREWLRDVVSGMDWLEWWEEDPRLFQGECVPLQSPPMNESLRAAWGSLIGVEASAVEPYVPAVLCTPVVSSRPYLVCCPDAVSNSQRRLPMTFWHELVRLAQSDGFTCYSMGSAHADPIDGCAALHGVTVRQAASYLKGADAVITLDTGLKWLAWATGQRSIVELYNEHANPLGWSDLGPLWTLRFAEATPEATWKHAQSLGRRFGKEG